MSEATAGEKIDAALNANATAQAILAVAEIRDALHKSSVKIETNSKGMAQVKVSVAAGESVEEMQRIKDLAISTYETAIRELGTRAEFS